MYRTKHPLYPTWASMHARCRDERHASFRYYGAKGIRVCDRWSDFWAFVSDMGPRPAGTTLDRIDPAADYAPENCRWATIFEQNSHKSDTRLFELNGEVLPLARWAQRHGMTPQLLHHRLTKQGMALQTALTLPADRWATRRALKEIK